MTTALLADLWSTGLVVAGFADVFRVVIGVILSLCGLGLFLMGLIAVADRQVRRGGLAAGIGAGLLALGLWLVGVWG